MESRVRLEDASELNFSLDYTMFAMFQGVIGSFRTSHTRISGFTALAHDRV